MARGGDTCAMCLLWLDLSDQIHDFLSDITLSGLIEREEIRLIADRQGQSGSNRIQAVEETEQESQAQSA